MPVLSEQITVTEPRVSTAGSLQISAWRLSRRCATNQRSMVTSAVRASGAAASARLTADSSNSGSASPRNRPRTTITGRQFVHE